ncbi:MAG: hypothetical protein ACFFBW_14690 [Promethearchaeota archaeon]
MKGIIKSFLLLLYTIFVFGLVFGGIVPGILTLLPDEASKPCYLGYYAHCSFAPFSTLILFGMALVGVVLLVKLIKYFKRKLNELMKSNSKIAKIATLKKRSVIH